jgi:predicted nucleic acid-binding protein
MLQLIDTSVWVDLVRPATPRPLKEAAAKWIMQKDARLADPVAFELLRYASDAEARGFEVHSTTVPMLATPSDIWVKAAELGLACRRQANLVKGLDLLIAAVALHHDVAVVTYDTDYEKIAKASGLKVELLNRHIIES